MKIFVRLLVLLLFGSLPPLSGELTKAAGAPVPVKVEVPQKWRTAPFDRERKLTVPARARISVLARVERARFMTVSPKGDVLVSQPNRGRILLIRQSRPAETGVVELVSGLRLPHGMVFHRIGDTLYLYVGESNQISRFMYANEPLHRENQQIVVPNLPDRSSPDLGGAYGHELKNITIGPDQKLYVDIASATNADPDDAQSDPVRSAIYRYDLDGRNRELFARGIRNAEGLAFLPGTNELWAVVNGRDNIRYPFRNGRGGYKPSDYGRLIQSYVDGHPPDAFIHVKEGANFGWPFANPNPDQGLDNMPFDPDFETNPDWSRVLESSFTRMNKGIPAHSAPLGFSFLQGSEIPLPFRDGAAVALHGSWNRSRRTGFKVIFFPWLPSGKPGPQTDLVTGWLNEQTQQVWGRPVDVVPDRDGDLLISDDESGTIYKLSFGE